MLVIEPKDPDEERDIRNRWNRIFQYWFYFMIITPLLILYYTSDFKTISYLFGNWMGIIGVPIILSGIIELIINVFSKKKPLISLNRRFIIICSCWAVLFMTGHLYNQFDADRAEVSAKDLIPSEHIAQRESILQQNEIRAMLLKESNKMNVQCPVQINRVMTLDSTSVINGTVFRMIYSFPFTKETMNETYGAMGYSADKEKESFQEQLIQMYRTQDYLEEFRQKKITIEAAYRDQNGELLYKFSATPGVDF